LFDNKNSYPLRSAQVNSSWNWFETKSV